MEIRNETQIDGVAAKWLRERAGLSQKAFWGAYDVTQPGGCRYERAVAPIPTAIRRLIFVEHVAGLKLDASTSEGAAKIQRAAQLAAADEHVNQAKRLLSEIHS